MLKSLVKTSLLMLKSMTKMLMLLIMEDSNSRSKMDQNSNRAVAKAKEAPRVIKEEKMVRNHVVTVEPTTHLISAQHMEKTVFSASRKDISVSSNLLTL